VAFALRPLGPRDALVVADVQNDFLSGGALEVPGGDAVVPVLSQYVQTASGRGAHVFAIRDWHPSDHCSFRERGGRWPRHCVQGTPGAEIAPSLHLPVGAVLVSKGSDRERDAYSAFDGTRLHAALRGLGVDRVLVGGLATDFCVLETVRDARARGYEVLLLRDAIRGIDRAASERAESEMAELGAVPVSLERVRGP
jgi:nicotinamidase/pyrazinamidase